MKSQAWQDLYDIMIKEGYDHLTPGEVLAETVEKTGDYYKDGVFCKSTYAKAVFEDFKLNEIAYTDRIMTKRGREHAKRG